MPKTYAKQRVEKRLPMAVGVQIAGHRELPGVETTFTENVSSRGVRVLTVRRWRPDDRVELLSLSGGFRGVARITYCQRARGNGFAVGLEFLEREGAWVITPPD